MFNKINDLNTSRYNLKSIRRIICLLKVKERLKIFILDVLPSVRIQTDYDVLFACFKPNNKTFLPDNTSTNKKDKEKRTKIKLNDLFEFLVKNNS